jgi:ABC-type phosphate transport system auxiliary subunit
MSQLNASDLKNRATDLKERLDALSAAGQITDKVLNEFDAEASRLAKDLQELSDWLTRNEVAKAA